MTLLPLLYLLVTSFTPLNLTDPASQWDFSQPMVNYGRLPGDERFINSLWVQLKLSFWTVSLQMLIGLGVCAAARTSLGMHRALRTVFLIPMVLPPIVVAIIWKVIYTPDISPMHRRCKAIGLDMPALITDPDWALIAIIIADTWEWFPLHDADDAGGVADDCRRNCWMPRASMAPSRGRRRATSRCRISGDVLLVAGCSG